MLDLTDHFDTVKFINLDLFSDRATDEQKAKSWWVDKEKRFLEGAEKAGLTGIDRYRAIEGEKSPCPAWFKSGNGAWGCLMSHLRLLQDVQQDGLNNYLVFEEDAVFAPNAAENISRVMKELGDDWDMIYFGGQHLVEHGRPWRKDGIETCIRANNVNRTHGFAVNKNIMKKMEQHIIHAPDYIDRKNWHIDHQLGALHQWSDYKIYAAEPWIVGQADLKSWISGRDRHPHADENGEIWWPVKPQHIRKD